MKVIVKIQCCKENKLIKPPKSKPLPYSDVFVDFPEIPRSRNRDLKTTNNAFQGCHVQGKENRGKEQPEKVVLQCLATFLFALMKTKATTSQVLHKNLLLSTIHGKSLFVASSPLRKVCGDRWGKEESDSSYILLPSYCSLRSFYLLAPLLCLYGPRRDDWIRVRIENQCLGLKVSENSQEKLFNKKQLINNVRFSPTRGTGSSSIVTCREGGVVVFLEKAPTESLIAR